ncbi:MAG: hypothetical protein P8188_15695 [Gemmatimonadota bacterium]|jgi:hypothetical protein
MTRAVPLIPLVGLTLVACAGQPEQPDPMPVDTIVRVDTITITREVPPPLPEGQAATVCLANGQNAEVRVSAQGDTLVGPRRVRLAELGPGVGFLGDYAADESWFVNDQAITFNRRSFSKFGQPTARDCQSLKIVGDYDGVNVFSEISATEPFRALFLPVRPGVFQPYQSGVGAVRG